MGIEPALVAPKDKASEWDGRFGRAYSNRNNLTPSQLDALYRRNYGITKTQMNREFLSDINRGARILEVGCNVGNQLVHLQKAGFTDLWGIEISKYAIEVAKQKTKGISIVRAAAADIPFKDEFFDLVFTSGVLIHIPPEGLPMVMDEIYRVGRKYIWCFEYFATEPTEVRYRGREELMWKNDFQRLFTDRFPSLKVVKEKKFKYLSNDNVDVMFLLQKKEDAC
jgi:pseudaminic acid biosynthesis-associated methylase